MKKSSAVPELHLDRSSGAPSLRKQIERQLATLIRNGTLPGGTRLPSSRLMARVLRVSRGTLVDAYEALLETGLLTSRAGSCVSVASFSHSVPNFGNLRRIAVAAHFPAHVCRLEDLDGTPLYFNVVH